MPNFYLHVFTYALFPNRKAEKTFGVDLRSSVPLSGKTQKRAVEGSGELRTTYTSQQGGSQMSRQDPISSTTNRSNDHCALTAGSRPQEAYGLRFKTLEFFRQWAIQHKPGKPSLNPPTLVLCRNNYRMPVPSRPIHLYLRRSAHMWKQQHKSSQHPQEYHQHYEQHRRRYTTIEISSELM